MAEQRDRQIVSPIEVDWSVADGTPIVQGKSLAANDSTIRWLKPVRSSVELRQSARTPQFYVEMLDGDRLPIRELIAPRNDRLPGRFGATELWVVPELLSTRRAAADQTPIRIRTRWLRRIVQGEDASKTGAPGTLRIRDGRLVTFRTVRFEPGQVVVLGEQGIVKAEINSIVELNLPTLDPWQAYLEQLAILSPRASVCLLRIHTPEGLSATFSPLRMRSYSAEGATEQQPSSLLVQPAWAIDPLMVETANVDCWEWQSPQEASLDRIAPTSFQAGSVLPTGRRPQKNRNVVGWPLVAGGAERRVGYGVAARSELNFPLPECAIGFRTLVGLDRAAGDGGCAKGLIYRDEAQGAPLYQSDFLIGSTTLLDSGQLQLTAAKRLLLIADPAHMGRPAGADPLDIRDLLDWISPTVTLDPTGLQSAIQQAAAGGIPGWEDWRVPSEDLSALEIEQYWQTASESASDNSKQAADAEAEPSERLPGAEPRFIVEVTSRDPFYSLSRSIAVDADARWLLVHIASRVDQPIEPPHVQVRFRGVAVAEFTAPALQPNVATQPVAIPWERFQGEQGELEIVCFPMAGRTPLRFGSVELSADLPLGASAISGQAEGREIVAP